MLHAAQFFDSGRNRELKRQTYRQYSKYSMSNEMNFKVFNLTTRYGQRPPQYYII